MAKNNKPILSILIDEDKRVKFADLARRNALSMSYLVNKAIDKMLEADSIELNYGESPITSLGYNSESLSAGMAKADVEELIKLSILSIDMEKLIKPYVESTDASIEVLRTELKKL